MIKAAQSQFLQAGTYDLIITNVEYQPKFNVVDVTFKTLDGINYKKSYNLKDKEDGTAGYPRVLFTRLYEKALKIPRLNNGDEIDEQKMVNKAVLVTFEEKEYLNKNGEQKKYLDIENVEISNLDTVNINDNIEDEPF